MTNCVPGEKLFYHKGGEITFVLIIENISDNEFERYRLKILDVISDSPELKERSRNIGEEFICVRSKNPVSLEGLWSLTTTG